METLTNNESLSICAACGGECCKTAPGIEAPERFLAARDPAGALADALASGNWVLVRHYGVPTGEGAEHLRGGNRDTIILYPRPATRAESGQGSVMAAEGGGECVFLAEGGCRLPFEERPHLCRALEPDVCGECESPWTRRNAAIAWFPHQELVRKALGGIIPDDPAGGE